MHSYLASLHNTQLIHNQKKIIVIYRLLIAPTIALFSLVFFQHTASAATLTVAVAANLQYALEEIKTEFKKETGQDLQLSYGSSGKFVTQIINGAPFDVFLSADMAYPDYLYQQSYATAAPKIYAYGSLVLWSIKKQDLAQWQSLLIGNSVSKIALANPKTAPYGREAMNALSYYKLETRLKPKLVFGDSISQTNQYIHSGLADIGFTAKSVVLSREMKDQGSWIEIPPESYQPIAQGAIILKHGKENNPIPAQQFYDFLSSAKARAIFQKSGYTLP
ncbi:molybdate ABC transporter substrate-binding protein [Undibacterium parvum]|uniref:Molybdate ABC transporter substrate-binding protein n=2 Tax=Undibacterium parvum TaxID=401471 RepID=A0A3Q9BTW6_9BURK|nr:molybdate ABC transporter substrate-binding protein [Undibacterium parvum]